MLTTNDISAMPAYIQISVRIAYNEISGGL